MKKSPLTRLIHDLGMPPEFELAKKSSANKKMYNYIRYITCNNKFITRVKLLRKKYKIPEAGFRTKDFLYKYKNKTYVGSPDHLYNNPDFNQDLDMLGEDFGIIWTHALRSIVTYNRVQHAIFDDMFKVNDLNKLLNGPFEFGENEKKLGLDILSKITKKYPIALLINPYVSQRDIVDYVKKFYKYSIFPFQKELRNDKIMLGKVRKKNNTVRKRNDFIFRNHLLPVKKIQSLVADKGFGVLEYTYINKIILTEKKNRNIL